MGAEPWIYFVPFESDLNAALQRLRGEEFKAGRYFPVKGGFLKEFGVTRPPSTIEEAIELAAETGTQSILDIEGVGEEPDYGTVCPLPAESLLAFYGTDKPTRAMVEDNQDFLEDVDRGQGVYIIIYQDGRPSEICFAGYSFD